MARGGRACIATGASARGETCRRARRSARGFVFTFAIKRYPVPRKQQCIVARRQCAARGRLVRADAHDAPRAHRRAQRRRAGRAARPRSSPRAERDASRESSSSSSSSSPSSSSSSSPTTTTLRRRDRGPRGREGADGRRRRRPRWRRIPPPSLRGRDEQPRRGDARRVRRVPADRAPERPRAPRRRRRARERGVVVVFGRRRFAFRWGIIIGRRIVVGIIEERVSRRARDRERPVARGARPRRRRLWRRKASVGGGDDEVRSIALHWSPYDRVGVVNAVP